jgi:hypothetical protein
VFTARYGLALDSRFIVGCNLLTMFNSRIAVGYDIVAGHVNTLCQDIIMYHFTSKGYTESSRHFYIYPAHVTVPFLINGSHFPTLHLRSFRTDHAAFPLEWFSLSNSSFCLQHSVSERRLSIINKRNERHRCSAMFVAVNAVLWTHII